MQEIAAQVANMPFQKYIAIVHTAREAEAKDIRAMSDKFDVCKCSLDEKDKLKDALKDCDVLVLLPPAESNKLTHSKTLLTAAKEDNVKSIVMLSSVGVDSDKPCLTEFKELEQNVIDSGIPYCILRSGFYAQNLLLYADQLARGQLPLPVGDEKLSCIDLADVGVAFAKILQEVDKHKGKIYTLTGGEVYFIHI